MNAAFDFKSFSAVLLRMLMTLVFGFCFLFLMEYYCGGNDICGKMKIDSIGLIKINLSDYTNAVRFLAFSYVVGFLLEISGIWCFKLLRKFKLEQYVMERWRIRKGRSSCAKKIIPLYDYFEGHPYAAGIHTLNHFYSMTPRPLLSFLLFAIILFRPYEWYIWLGNLSAILFIISTGLFADMEANDFDEKIQKELPNSE